MAEGHFPDFESAFDAAPLGQERQVRIGCCSVTEVDSEDPAGAGLSWTNPAGAKFMDGSYADRVLPAPTHYEPSNDWCLGFTKWLVFQGFKFDLPGLKAIKDIQFAFRGHQIDNNCGCAAQLYNWAATRGGILYPLVIDAQYQRCTRENPISPDPPYSYEKGHTAGLGDIPGTGNDCSTDEVFCIQVSNWCAPEDTDYGLFFTQDIWNTDQIDQNFGIAIQAAFDCVGFSGHAYIDCCGVAIYFEP